MENKDDLGDLNYMGSLLVTEVRLSEYFGNC